MAKGNSKNQISNSDKQDIQPKIPEQTLFNESKEHYESLLAFFKNSLAISVSILGVVATVIAILTFSDRNQMKAEMKESMQKMEQDLKEEKAEFSRKVQEMKNDAKEKLREVDENARFTLENTEQNADNTFNSIRNNAVTAAIDASKIKVEQTFKDNNIKNLIEDVAHSKLEGQVQSIIDKQLNHLSDNFSYSQNQMPIFMLSLDKIRWNDASGLYTLDSIYRNTKDPTSKNIARVIMIEKGRGYKSSAIEQQNSADSTSGIKKVITAVDKKKLIIKLRNDVLNNAKDLYEVTWNIIWLSELLNKPIDNFDLEAVRNIPIN